MTHIWAGEFGDEYTRRNRAKSEDDIGRRAMWSMLLPSDLKSVLEVGANVGKNLAAISRLSEAELFASEPNELAREELAELVSPQNIRADYCDHLFFPDGVADLVITCGVLIHISAARLVPSMKELHRCSRRWIISAEYFAPSEEMVPYRGKHDALWRRDYGSIWLDNFPDLQCYAAVFAWKRMTGLDNLTFWVFEKGNKRH